MKKIIKITYFCAILMMATMFTLHAQNTSLPVGAIPGAIDVSPLGEAIYSIPIEVVPGTQGIEPNLSIVYNSTGGMGLLGMKWNLAGLSAITRCGQSQYFDNNITAIQFNSNDRYELDGERLINISGSYGAIGTEYATEMEDFSRIISYGTTNGHPSYFVLYTDDGSEIEYGISQALGHSGFAVLGWYVSKVTDANGNYMTFNYENYDAEICIKSIHYTGNTGISTYASVEFNYTTLPDTMGRNYYYVGNNYSGIPQTKLLQTITVKYENSVVRKYQFNYNVNDTNESTTHLKEIVLYDANGVQLNATTINWGAKKIYNQREIISQDRNEGGGYILAGDFNGDGYSDYLISNFNYNNYNNPFIGWRLFLFNPSTNSFYEELSAADNTTMFYNMFAQDVNGDGKDELIININRGGSKILSLPSKTQIGETINSWYHSAGDFDGDGKKEMVFGTKVKKIVNNTIVDFCNPMENVSIWDKVDLLDANGDGKKDLLVGDTIYEFNGYEFQPLFNNNIPNFDSYTPVRYGDINGDGITDVIAFNYWNSKRSWKAYVSKGDGTFEVFPLDTILKHTIDNSIFPTMLADLNGDGKDDIIQLDVGSPPGGGPIIFGVTIFFSKGWKDEEWYGGSYLYTKKEITFPYSIVNYLNADLGDFNGDGNMDLIFSNHSNVYFLYFNEDNDYEFVQKIEDGIGKKVHLNYKHQYFNDHITNQKHFLSVVNSLMVSNGINNGITDYKFQYNAPVFSYKRRGLLGFMDVKCINNLENKSIIWEYAFDNAKQILKPMSQKIEHNTASILETNYNMAYLGLGGLRYMPYSQETTIKDILGNAKTITTTSLYSNGRIQTRNTKNYNASNEPAANWLLSETNNYTYSTITINGKQKKTVPKNIITTQQYGTSGAVITDTVIFSYYLYANGRDIYNTGCLKSVRKSNADGAITITFDSYSSTGICLKKTLKANGCEDRIETFELDSKQRFIKKITNPKNHSIQFTYNEKIGKKLTETDPNGLITNYQYDSFGNLTKITFPNGTQTQISIDWNDNQNLKNAKYYTKTSSTGKADITVYFDVLGRELCRLEDGYYVESKYNNKGQLVKISYPFKNFYDRDTIWNYYTYDDLGRKKSEKTPFSHISYSYDNRKITTTDHLRNNIYLWKNYDVLGRIIEAKDEGGIITYSYNIETIDSKKQYKTIITNGADGSNTSFISNLWGNRLSITDPNAGTITSSYNGFNELIQQIDARKDTTTYKYDVLGRVTEKRFAALSPTDIEPQTLSYTYDFSNANSKGIGKLYKIEIDSVESEILNYDSFSRLSTHTKIIDDNYHYFDYAYNSNGQLLNLTYPEGFGIKYSYTPTGKLKDIRRSDDNTLIYEVNSRNKFQQPTNCTYGNNKIDGISTKYTYNAYGLITQIQTNIGAWTQPYEPGIEIGRGIIDKGSGLILDYNYNYDNKGLMISRSENIVNKFEEFTYDNLDRLIGINSRATGSGETPQYFSYAQNGNIEINSNVGNYFYNIGLSNAVQIIEIEPNAISANQSEVTYNFFNQPTLITEGDYELELFYGANQQRNKAVLKRNDTIESTRYYASKLYEKEVIDTITKHYHYIYGDNRVVALHISIEESTDSIYYIHTDHLGSYCVITNANGNVVQRNNFDAWGNVITPNDTLLNFSITNRGFTGHEHYPFFKIINMNGRLYDPVIGRFFSPDNFVMNSGFTQDFNRYSYARNNPLKYVDRTGQWYDDYDDYGDDYRDDDDDDGGPGKPPWNDHFQDWLMSTGMYNEVWFTNGYGSDGFYDNDDDYDGGNDPTNQPDPFDIDGRPSDDPPDPPHPPAPRGGTRTGLFGQSFASLLGNIEFGYNMAVDGTLKATPFAKNFGIGLTGLSIFADATQMYFQAKNEGYVNPVTATNAGANFVGLISKGMSWIGLGGTVVPFIGAAAGYVGIAITIGQSWWMIYKPMDELRFAPLSIDKKTGEPYFGMPTQEYYFYQSLHDWW